MTKPVVLLIRDGWGHRDEPHKNAPKQAHTPFTDHLNKTYPSTLIQASEQAVGLPEGYFGNSEVGHMTIGAGDNLKQPLIRIQEDIEAEQFAHKDAFQTTYNHVESHDATLHIMGLVQTQGVHSHVDHLHALLDHLLTTDLDVELHLFTDGRDAPVRASTDKIKRIQNRIHDTNVSIASISGRYYAMDRDHRWDRTEQAYNAIHRATGPTYTSSALQYIKARHEDDETDEFTTPAHRASYNGINNDDDAVIFYNFRGDRPRQLTKAFIEPGFDAFNREQFTAPFTTMTKYYDDVKADNLHVAYDRIPVENPLGEILADKGLKQLRIAESEKFPHVTYFMNGRRDEPYPGEDQVHIPSPKVSTYDKQPEMSLPEVNERLLNELDKDKYDVVIVNYANGDMVGHTGDMDAAVKACEAVDKATKNLVEKVQEKNGTIFITADHGNCDIMEGEYRTSHTLSPVRFIDASSNPKEPRINGLKGIKEMILDEVA
jgi:2,3-bisphosphoglycerate-independent phosphoglycerate mutase